MRSLAGQALDRLNGAGSCGRMGGERCGQDPFQGETMNEIPDVYKALADHLDRLPAGFPSTPDGIELRILRRLFTPEEARLARLLTLKPETPAAIAERTGMDEEEIGPRLESMSRKGLVYRLRKGEQARFMAAQFVIGIWEYHVKDLDPDLIRDMNEYLPFFFSQSYLNDTPQLRTIPVPRAFSPEQTVMPYEEARDIVRQQEQLVAAPCICRQEHRMMGRGCDKPLETCLVFGSGAAYYEENGLGRPISREEALAILEQAEEAGLVLQPSNAQKAVNICTCCGCCCQILKNLKSLPEPARYVASNYYAAVDPDACTGCETCVERCQMDAVRMEDGLAVVLGERCIGCGLCVPTCPGEAMRLESKPAEERREPPRHLLETYQRIGAERLARLRTAKSRI